MFAIREVLALPQIKPADIELKNLIDTNPTALEVKNQHYWEKLANTPRSYVLHPTLEKSITFQSEKKAIPSEPEAKKSKPLSILCFGCHGNLDLKAEVVAKRIAEAAEKDQVLFIVVTGDNFYPDGVSSPNDEKFQKYFYEKFLKHASLKERVFFFVLGNHDYNYRNFQGIHKKTGFDVALNEVIHTFLNQQGEFDSKRIDYLSRSNIDIETLKKDYHWMMPSRFYKTYYPECNAQFFFLDSNTYLRDYLELHQLNTVMDSIQKNHEATEKMLHFLEVTKGLTVPDKKESVHALGAKLHSYKHQIKRLKAEIKLNQVHWLKKSIAENPNARNIVIQHHPLDSMGKRAEASDAKHYLSIDERAAVKQLLQIANSCDLLLMPTLPKDLSALPGISKAAYIIINGAKLFYLDKINDQCIPIEITQAKLKELQQKLEVKEMLHQEGEVWLYEALLPQQLAAVSHIVAHKSRRTNYSDMLKMAFKKDGILSKLKVIIHSHDHASSLFYSSKYNEKGEMLAEGYCQLTVGGGGGEFQEMEEFKHIRQIPIYAGYGCSTITFHEDELIFNIYNAKSPDEKDWHSQGKFWSFSNKNPLPRFNWDDMFYKNERDFYLHVRQIILNGCYDYFDSYERYKQTGGNYFFRSVKGRLGYYGSEGVQRGLTLISVLNNPNPSSASILLDEVANLLEGSTNLLEKVNHYVKHAQFKLKNNQFTALNFEDLRKKYQAIFWSRPAVMTSLSESSLWVQVDATESIELPPVDLRASLQNSITNFYQKTFSR